MVRKVTKISFTVFVGFILFLISYTIWDNERIIIVHEKVEIRDLPEQLEGFTLLQISDLHEKEFGKQQKRLIDLINEQHYHAILFTGDMLDNSESDQYESFFTLLDGITNKEIALFVPGNTDPLGYTRPHPIHPFEKTPFRLGMEERGVHWVDAVYTVNVGEARLSFVEFELAIQEKDSYLDAIAKKIGYEFETFQGYYDYHETLATEMNSFHNQAKSDVMIGLTHYPIVDRRIDAIEDDPLLTMREFDLILAGHYHGGQIRFPFVGALFVPEPWYDNSGYFPPQDRVKGLWEYNGIQQYVSAGLGSSDAISFLKFRFLNPPEINVITLTKKEE